MTASADNEFPQNLQESIENIIKKEGFTTYDVVKRALDADGGSLLSKQYLVTVKGKTKDGEKETHIFVKGFISIKQTEGTLNLSRAFAAEAFVYNELYQVFAELQEEAEIPAGERLRMIKSYGESSSDGIFLENVAIKGYKSCDRTYTMSLEVAEMALIEIAKFHALSFVIKAIRPEYYKKNIETVKHPMTFEGQWQQTALQLARLAARHVTGVSREKLEKFLPDVIFKWRHYQLDQTLTRCCLCHGDYRLNNLLMKHNGDKLEDLYLVDYQIINFGCPINDFLFFIFVGTSQQFRRQHLEYLKEFYYKTFSEFLRKFNLDSEDIYPKGEFDKDYKERLDYGLLVVLYFMPFFLGGHEALSEGAPSGKQPSSASAVESAHELFTERIQGIVDDYVAWGYL